MREWLYTPLHPVQRVHGFANSIAVSSLTQALFFKPHPVLNQIGFSRGQRNAHRFRGGSSWDVAYRDEVIRIESLQESLSIGRQRAAEQSRGESHRCVRHDAGGIIP